MPNHYEALGVGSRASAEDIRHAYRRLVKEAHPDRAGDEARFRRITQAYDVLSDPDQRAAYDRSLRPAPVAAPAPAPRRRSRSRRWVGLSVVAVLVGGVAWLVATTVRQSVGDGCLIGTWQGGAFEVPFRGAVDGREIEATIRGGEGVVMTVGEDGIVRTDYAKAAPLIGADGPYRIEGVYLGRTVETWRAGEGRVKQSSTDASGLTFQAKINDRPPDRPLAVTVLDREYPYTCTPTTLELGPYRYARA